MRIAVVVGRYPTRSETFVRDQIHGLVDRGHEVRVFAEGPGDLPPGPPATAAYSIRYWGGLARYVTASAEHRSPVYRLGRQLRRILARHRLRERIGPAQFDVLYCHFGPNGELVRQLRAGGLLQGRLVVAFHGADMSSIPRQRGPGLYRGVFAEADLLLPVSDLWRSRLIQMGASAEQVTTHRLGVPCERLTWRARRLSAGGPIRLLTVARLVPKKGIGDAINAVALLRERGLRDLEYRIVGDGPLAATLREQALALGLGDSVRFFGARGHAEVLRLMDEADLFILPSVTAADGDMEGIPVALMEAMALGLPVITTRHSGIPELIPVENHRLLAAEGSPEALCALILELVDHPDLCTGSTAANRRQIETAYSQGRQIAELEALLKAVT